MPIVDVDAHFEPGEVWLESFPDLKRRLPEPDQLEFIVEFTVGDFLRRLPPEKRPTARELIPPALVEALFEEKAGETARRGEFEGQTALGSAADGAARIRWMDAQGIDYQNVICLSGVEAAKVLPDAELARETVSTCNDWLAETTAPFKDRLFPVTVLTGTDMNWAVEEMTRMRARGSRQFIIPANPVGGVPAYHPDWDRVWSAATDLGMIAMVHGGFDRAEFDPGWANTAGNMVLLPVVFAEVGVNWLSFIRREIDSKARGLATLHCGEYEYPLLPSEYMARNVRITPLPTQPQESPALVMGELDPEMLIFSSDFPHIEGSDEPMDYYERELAGASDKQKAGFYGDNINAAYARMGDPIF
jgi:predicted TIM-barrel fold metal-dependent hydrolase